MTITVTASQNHDLAARMKAIGVTQDFLAEYLGISQKPGLSDDTNEPSEPTNLARSLLG
jgi:hypothetical protein